MSVDLRAKKTWAALLLLAIASFSAWSIWNQPLRRVRQLLDSSYAQMRTTDWRFPETPWHPVQRQRGGSSVARPIPLLQAMVVLGNTPAVQDDTAWGLLQAKAWILENRVGDAVDLLERIRLLSPDSSETLSPLAAAYGMLAEKENRGSDFARSLDFSTRVLYKNPNDSAAAFNRAVAFEKLAMVPEAEEAWKRFLEIEADPKWRAEAAERLQAVLAIRRQRTEALASSDSTDAALERKAADWLLNDRHKAREIGEVLKKKYGEAWLTAAAAETVDSTLLFLAVESNAGGRALEVLGNVTEASRLYRFAPAHRLRFEVERVVALNRMKETADCIARARRIVDDPESAGFHWLRTQAMAYYAGCLGMEGRHAESLQAYEHGIDYARSHGMSGLELRVIGVAINTYTLAGDLWRVWRQNRDALERLQTSPYSIFRTQQCLVNYALGAEKRGLDAAATTFMIAAADTLKGTAQNLMQAANRTTAAASALRSRFDREALTQVGLAESLIALEPDSILKTRYRDSLRLISAEALLATGRIPESLEAIGGISSQLSLAEDEQRNRLLGLGYLRQGNLPEGERRLRKAYDAIEGRAARLSRAQAAVSRREALDAYRALATHYLEYGSPDLALEIWLAAHGSSVAQAPDLTFLKVTEGYAVWRKQAAPRFELLRANHGQVRDGVRKLAAWAMNPAVSIDAIRRQGRQVFERWFEPLQLFGTSCSGGPISILPDGDLAELPWPVLVDRSGRWISESCQIIVSSTQVDSRKLHLPLDRSLIVRASETAEPLPDLPEAAREVVAARRVAKDNEVLAGHGVTGDAIIRRLSEARLFHFAGHGFSWGDNGGLYVADGTLSGNRIRELNLMECEVVVLSACATSIGERSGMANSESLVRSFLDAGARSVLATRWSVDSVATTLLMERFYGSLDTAGGLTDALSRSVRSLQLSSEYAHPYYWAAFQIYE